jgi:dTMP kinase
MFIVFEGIDGSGKTTLSKMFAELLKREGKKVIWTFEPYNEKIREIVKENNFNPLSETLLFLADRKEHIEQVIKPYLKKGYWVISDRYYLSTLAYQGYGKGLDIVELEKLNKEIIGNIEPDLWIYIETPLDTAIERLKKRKKMDKFENIRYLKRVKKGFEKLIKRKKNVIVLDGGKSLIELLKIIEKNLIIVKS